MATKKIMILASEIKILRLCPVFDLAGHVAHVGKVSVPRVWWAPLAPSTAVCTGAAYA